MLMRALHETCPDWHGGFRAFELNVLIIVKADPYDAQQLRSVAGEPGIVRSAGFAGRRKDKAAPLDAGAAAPAQHVLHEARDQEAHARIEHFFRLRLRAPD